MFEDVSAAGSAQDWVWRLDRSAALRNWAIAGLTRIEFGTVAYSLQMMTCDSVTEFAESMPEMLVRVSAVDGGGGDQNAYQLVWQLLNNPGLPLTCQVPDRAPKALPDAVRTPAICSYSWRRRIRAWRSNLRSETRRAVRAELPPNPPIGCQDGNPSTTVRTISPPAICTTLNTDALLVELVPDAIQAGVDAVEVDSLRAAETARDGEGSSGADGAVVPRQGTAVRASYRRRAGTLETLRARVRERREIAG